MALATLSIDIVARLASLEAGLDKANRLSAKNAAEIESRWNRVNSTFKAVGGVIGAAFATQQVASFIDRTIDGLDKLNDVADSTGSTVEKISALEDAGARAGTGIDVIEAALVRFNAQLKEADGKNGVSLVLQRIGLDAAELRKQDPADALQSVAVALASTADDGSKARAVYELFGKSMREVAPLLKDLAEAGTLQATVTTEQAAQAEKLNKQLFALQKNVTDAGRAIAADLVPALNAMFDGFRQGGLRGAFDGLGEVVGLGKDYYRGRELKFLADDIKDLEEQIAKDSRGFYSRSGVPELQKELEEKRKLYQAARDEYLRIGPGASRRPANEGGGTYNPPSIGDIPGKPEAAKVTEAQRYLENLQKQSDKLRELSSYEQALADIQAKRIDGITPKLEAQILAQAKLNDLAQRDKDMRTAQIELTTRVAKAQLDSIEKLEAGNKALREEIELLGLDEYGQAAIEKARLRSIRTLKEEERARRVAAGAADETLQALDREIELLKEREDLVERRLQKSVDAQAAPAVGAVDDFARRAAENIQDQLGDALYNAVTGRTDDILESFGELLLRMATQAQAAQLGKYLFGEAVGGTGSGLVGLIGGAIGNYFGSPDTSQLPTGDFSRMDRQLYQAAEGIDRVPHDGFIAQLHKDEKVVPARYRDSGAGVQNNIVVNNQSGDVQASAQARPNGTGGADIEVTIKRIAKSAVAEDIAAGGQVDRALRGAYGMGRQTPRRS